jgi:orotate phosphoribosyltransferase
MTNPLKQYQTDFIKFLLETGALKFGQFTLKSGRLAPYFVNFGDFNSAQSLDRLGYFYAQQVLDHKLADINTVFGPTYKGIPLSITTAFNLTRETKRDYGFTFNRKEAKQHGEAGLLVGTGLNAESRLVIVEDVITAGTTMREVIPLVRSYGSKIEAVIIAVDRCEKGAGAASALQEVQAEFDIKILPIVTIKQIHQYLEQEGILSGVQASSIQNYLEQYGA